MSMIRQQHAIQETTTMIRNISPSLVLAMMVVATVHGADPITINNDGTVTMGATVSAPYLLASAAPITKTDAFTATAGSLYLITGTDHDFDVNLPPAGAAGSGSFVTCAEDGYAQANKQYTLRPVAGEQIDGRSSLVLVHTNGIRLMSDGVGWHSIVKHVDTEFVAAGPIPVSATTTNPSKPASPMVDVMQWRRRGDSVQVRYQYRHNAAGVSGSGAYLLSLPNGFLANTSLTPASTTVVQSAGRIGFGMACNSGSSYSAVTLMAYMYDSSRFAMWQMSDSKSALYATSSTAYVFSLTNLKLTVEVMVPIQGW